MINTRDSFAAKGSVSSILLYDLGMASLRESTQIYQLAANYADCKSFFTTL